jgi:PIN domain nuclease of toxin-antitoxin system
VRLLLDTHTIFWVLMDRVALSATSLAAIDSDDNDVYVSVASAWEMAIKVGIGKWPEAAPLVANFENEMLLPRFGILPITISHARAAGQMQAAHKDPFDRLLAAQAIVERLTLVTADEKVQGLGAPWLW